MAAAYAYSSATFVEIGPYQYIQVFLVLLNRCTAFHCMNVP